MKPEASGETLSLAQFTFELPAELVAQEPAARREDAYYVAYLARLGLVPGLQPELRDRLIAAGGALDAEPGDPDAGDDVERPDLGVDPDDPEHASLLCGADPANPCTDPDHDHS